MRRRLYLQRLSRNLKLLGLGLFMVLALGSVFYTRAGMPTRVYAAASNTLNFQARLLKGSGTIVPDGTYSVQFKLYNVSSGGVAQWTETQGSITVKSGYLSVYLGSVTSFPGTIDWSQQQWLTMNVNGDGEMSPRLQLTAVPNALHANEADALRSGSNLLTADNLAQIGPSSPQVVNLALSALRLNQTGAGGLLQLQGNGSDVFTVNKLGDMVSLGSGTFSGGTLNLGTATQAGGLVLYDGSSNTGRLQTAALASNRTYTFPDADGTVCLTTTCGGAANAFINGGNLFGGAATLGTNDNFGLSFRTNNTNQLALDTSGNLNLLNGGLQIGGNTVLTSGQVLQNVTADTSILSSGSLGVARGGTGAGTFTANGILFGNGTGAIGVTAAGTTGQCLIATTSLAPAWGSCAGAGSGVTLQAAYTGGGVITTTDAKNLSFTLADTATDSNYLINIATGSTSKFAVQSNGVDVLHVTSAGTVIDSGGLTVTSGGFNNNSGNITNAGNIGGVGTLTLTGAISGATSFTGSGNINTTAGALQTNSTNRIDNSGNLVNIGNLTASGALTISSGGSGDLILDSASNILVIAATDTTLQRVAIGSYTIDLKDSGATTLLLDNSGSGTANLNLNDGALQIAGTTVLTNGKVLQNVTADTSILATGLLGVARGGTGAGTFATNGVIFGNGTGALGVTAAGTGGQVLLANGSGVPAFMTLSGGATVDSAGVVTINSVAPNSITLGTDTTGNYIASLGALVGLSTTGNSGEGATPTLSVLYGATANTAVQGNTALTCASGSGNLSGGGGVITLGSGGSCGAITTNMAVSFTTSITTPLVTNAGALTVSTTGANDLTLTSGSGLVFLNASTIRRTAIGTTTFDLADSANTSFAFTNSGSGNLNLTADGTITAGTGLFVASGGATITGNSTISGSLSGLSALSSSGNIDFAALSAGGLVKANVTTGRLSVAAAGTDYQVPLAFNNGLTNTSNTVQLGGSLLQNTTLTAGNSFGLTLSSDLAAGNRSTNLFTLSQADDGTANSLTGNIFRVDQLDTTTASSAVYINNGSAIAGGYGLTVDNANTTANGGAIRIIGVAGSNVKGLDITGITSGTGITNTAMTTGIGALLGGSAITTGTALQVNTTAVAVTSAKYLDISGATSSSITANFTGSYINVAPIRNMTATATRNDSGNLLNLIPTYNITGTNAANYTISGVLGNINRMANINNANSTFAYASTAAALSIQSNITCTAGSCSDASNILSLAQNFSTASGAVLNLVGAGTGNLAILDATNTSANGASIDVQSSSSSQYALNVTANNGTTNILYARADGNVGIGNTSPSALLSVGSASQFRVTSTGAITSVGLTSAGAAVSLNDTSNFATNINSGTSSGTVTIGGGSAPLVIDSTNFDVSSAGALSGITTIGASGLVTLSGNTTSLALTGTPTNSATASLVQIGSAIASGNTTTNGGTYIGLNASSGGAGSAADFINMQVNGATKFKVANTGTLTINNLAGVTVAACTTSQYIGNGVRITGGVVTAGTCRDDASGISDVRVKKDITSVGSVLEKLEGVRVVTFNFKVDELPDLNLDHGLQYGVIAQELEQIFPELVSQREDGYKEVNFRGLSFYTLKAVTELAAKVDAIGGGSSTNGVSTGGTLRLTNEGALQNITGLSLVSGGASIAGGINSNGGGLSNTGAILGATTIDAQSLSLHSAASGNLLTLTKDSQGVFTVFNNGALEIKLDADNAFAVKKANGDDVFSVNTAGGLVRIGGVSSDDKAILLVLDTKATPGDPTGVNGAQYYNGSDNKFRCFQNGQWQDCLPAANSEYTLITERQNWADMPSEDTEFPGQQRSWIDLGNAREFRMTISLAMAADDGSTCRIQYALADDGPWINLADSGDLSINHSGSLKSDWKPIASSAHKEVLIRVMCHGGTSPSTAQAAFNNVKLQLR